MAPECDKRERALTDQSLSGERTAADRMLEQHAEQVETKVDTDVAKSREAVDEIRHRSRAETDAELSAELPRQDRTQLEEERRVHDHALKHERAVADAKLEAERAARKRAIAELLSAEREQTDEDLRCERDRADEEVDTRDDALASISHELRNLVGIIAMSAKKLSRESKADSSSQTGEVARISRSTDRMLRLVTDLLDVASIGYGRLTIVPRPSNTKHLLDELRDTFEPVAHTKGVSLGLLAEVGPESLSYDTDRIHQVLANLLANAIKFTPRGGHIEIEAHRIDGELQFSVRDDGPGISPSERDTIFERFRKSDNHNATGHGLGLYICRAVMDAHHGRIWVDSVPGHGSAFHVTLPVTV